MNATNRLTTTQPVLQEGNAGERPLSFGHSPADAIQRWYVVEAEYHASSIARDSIVALGLGAYLPTRLVLQRKRHSGVQRPPEPVYVPIFFQYLFAQFDAGGLWPTRARGVKRILMGANQSPYPVSDAWIAALQEGEEARNRLPPVKIPRIAPGTLVLVRGHGDFNGRVATVLKCNGLNTTVEVADDAGKMWQILMGRSDVSDE